GFEIVLGGYPVKNKDFTWEITGIFNRNRNKAISIGKALTFFSTNAGAPIAILEGYPIGIFYGTFFATDGSGNPLKNALGILQQEKGLQNNPTSFTPQRDPVTGLPIGGTVRKII
ncbi:MAG: SusC/RagA family TonB-linked outer membrane protein, partial [Chitinophagaceae bacterium]